MENTHQISLDTIRKNEAVNKFLDKIPFVKRMVIFKPLAEKYMKDGIPEQYQRRVRRTTLEAVEIAEIMEMAKKEGFTPQSIADAERVANQLKAIA